EKADTILEGEIIKVTVNTISRDNLSALPQEQIVSILVNFVWKDLRSGKILCERRNFQAAATYYPTLGEDRFVGRQEAAERLRLAARAVWLGPVHRAGGPAVHVAQQDQQPVHADSRQRVREPPGRRQGPQGGRPG